jgi:oxalate decarboxylase/phosphoglucose isomerase-like protein (cupin superfamily)
MALKRTRAHGRPLVRLCSFVREDPHTQKLISKNNTGGAEKASERARGNFEDIEHTQVHSLSICKERAAWDELVIK